VVVLVVVAVVEVKGFEEVKLLDAAAGFVEVEEEDEPQTTGREDFPQPDEEAAIGTELATTGVVFALLFVVVHDELQEELSLLLLLLLLLPHPEEEEVLTTGFDPEGFGVLEVLLEEPQDTGLLS
jgi:hypothetical protein